MRTYNLSTECEKSKNTALHKLYISLHSLMRIPNVNYNCKEIYIAIASLRVEQQGALGTRSHSIRRECQHLFDSALRRVLRNAFQMAKGI